jgi:hypothetical protein
MICTGYDRERFHSTEAIAGTKVEHSQFLWIKLLTIHCEHDIACVQCVRGPSCLLFRHSEMRIIDRYILWLDFFYLSQNPN